MTQESRLPYALVQVGKDKPRHEQRVAEHMLSVKILYINLQRTIHPMVPTVTIEGGREVGIGGWVFKSPKRTYIPPDPPPRRSEYIVLPSIQHCTSTPAAPWHQNSSNNVCLSSTLRPNQRAVTLFVAANVNTRHGKAQIRASNNIALSLASHCILRGVVVQILREHVHAVDG